jgi:hypothetical protein
MNHRINKAIGIFLTISGLIGVIVQLLTTPYNLRLIAFLLLFITLLLLGIWIIAHSIRLRLKAKRALPLIKKLEEISTRYYIDQATPEDIDWIARLEAKVYPSEDAVPGHILKEWYSCNPSGFSVIKTSNGQKVGHIDILPLRPVTLRAFLEGNIVERDIRGDSLYSQAETHLIRNLYVESIIVLLPKGLSNAPAILHVLSRFISLVNRVCDPTNVEKVYAIAASDPGKSLLIGLGFDQIKLGDERADHHDFFAAKFVDLAAKISNICGDRLLETALLKKTLDTGTGRDLAER